VYGRTHGGKLKKVCDHCSHVSRLARMGKIELDEPKQDRAAIIERAANEGVRAVTPTPRERKKPAPARPQQPVVDPIWREPF
jgi:hypothetical protein